MSKTQWGWPTKGQSLHDETRAVHDRNGIIALVDRQAGEILVIFQGTKECVTYDIDDIRGNWTDKFTGIWRLDS